MQTLYHVSAKENFNNIMEQGLIPQMGERSEELNEEEAVFLFPCKEDMDNALYNWLGEWYCDKFGDDYPLVSLEVNVPDNFHILDGDAEYEKICKIVIDPEYIKYLKDE